MGEIAARLADRAWITSDNPRSEDPDAIIAEIAAGVARVWRERERYARLADRQAAIGSALAWARPGDTWRRSASRSWFGRPRARW